jgi:hypothetical protein
MILPAMAHADVHYRLHFTHDAAAQYAVKAFVFVVQRAGVVRGQVVYNMWLKRQAALFGFAGQPLAGVIA